ncbi:MAG TPA: PhnD/SsuA/transferrin family substrate-binding protein [Bacillota bacterium]
MKKLGLIILAGLLCFASHGLVGAQPRQVQVMALSGTTGLAMARLMDQAQGGTGSFKYSILKDPQLLMGKLIAGEAEIAALPINQAAILYNKGVAITVPAIIGWGVLYIVGADPSVRHWTDLKGKTINLVAKGAVPDLLFRYLSRKNGINPDRDLKITYTASPVEAAQLVAAGKVSLAALPEPWVTEVLERVPQLQVLLDFQTEWSRLEQTEATYPQTCVVVSTKLLSDYPDLVRGFLNQLELSIDWLNKHPGPGGILAEKYVQISATAVRKGLKRCNLRYQPIHKVKREVAHFLSRLGGVAPAAIGGKLPDDGFYSQP